MNKKTCAKSLAVRTSYVLPPDTNSYRTLLVVNGSHMDDVALIAASRHAETGSYSFN
jgi:acyl-CoA hydrolase